MSATKVRQGGRVQLEQPNMPLSLNKAKMPKGGFFVSGNRRNTISDEEISRGNLRWDKMRSSISWAYKVMAAIERHPAMLHHNHTDGCLPCQNSTAKTPYTCWLPTGMGAPPPDRHRQPTIEPMQPLPKTTSMSPGENEGPQSSQIDNLPSGYVYSHTPLRSRQNERQQSINNFRYCKSGN